MERGEGRGSRLQYPHLELRFVHLLLRRRQQHPDRRVRQHLCHPTRRGRLSGHREPRRLVSYPVPGRLRLEHRPSWPDADVHGSRRPGQRVSHHHPLRRIAGGPLRRRLWFLDRLLRQDAEVDRGHRPGQRLQYPDQRGRLRRGSVPRWNQHPHRRPGKDVLDHLQRGQRLHLRDAVRRQRRHLVRRRDHDHRRRPRQRLDHALRPRGRLLHDRGGQRSQSHLV